MGTPKVMELLDPSTGKMRCKVCGAVHWANIKPDSGGKYYRGSWQCQNGCKLEDKLKKLDTSGVDLNDDCFDLQGFYGITNTNKLFSLGAMGGDKFGEEDLRRWKSIAPDEKIVERFDFYPPIGSKYNPEHTTDWARAFWEETRPDSDFDEEFQTDEMGVFDRLHQNEHYNLNFDKWKHREQLSWFKEMLREMGYTLEV